MSPMASASLLAAGHVQEGNAAALADQLEFAAHAGAKIGVERAGRFVEQHQRRFGDERACQRHRRRRPPEICATPRSSRPDRSTSAIMSLTRACAMAGSVMGVFDTIFQSEGNVSGDRQMRKEAKFWNTKPMSRRCGGIVSIRRSLEHDRAEVRLLEAGDDARQCHVLPVPIRSAPEEKRSCRSAATGRCRRARSAHRRSR